MSKKLNSSLVVGINYINKTTININEIDNSEVIKVTPATLKTSINVVRGNGYNVSKNKITRDVSKLNYTISASGIYGEYCGTDINGNFVFKVLQDTTIIDNNNNEGILIPVNTKLTLSKNSSNEYMFENKNKLINNTNRKDGELQNTVNKVVNDAYDVVTRIGKPENVMSNSGGRSYKKHKKTRVKTLVKKYKTLKNHKTRKYNKK